MAPRAPSQKGSSAPPPPEPLATDPPPEALVPELSLPAPASLLLAPPLDAAGAFGAVSGGVPLDDAG